MFRFLGGEGKGSFGDSSCVANWGWERGPVGGWSGRFRYALSVGEEFSVGQRTSIGRSGGDGCLNEELLARVGEGGEVASNARIESGGSRAEVDEGGVVCLVSLD